MSDATVAGAAVLLRDLAEPRAGGEDVKDVIERVRKAAGLAYWRTFDIWYGKARRVDPSEMEKIQEALRLKNRKSARNELHELKLRIANLEARLSLRDADFHQPDIDFARQHVGGPGGMGGRR